jgi:hypothetical protein
MRDDNVRLPSGINEQGRYVHISQVPSGATHLVCPYCGGLLTAKKGRRIAYHFAHTEKSCLEAETRDFSRLDLPIYDRFKVYISVAGWRELQKFHDSQGEDGDKEVLRRHDPPLIREAFNPYRLGGHYELSDEGKIPFGEATLSKFADFQMGYVYRQHTELSDTVEFAYYGQPIMHGWGDNRRQVGWQIKPAPEEYPAAVADLNIYRAQVARLYDLHLYLLEVQHSDGILYKIGCSSRDTESRIAEIRRELLPFLEIKNIKVDRLCLNRGAVERYAQHRYHQYRKLIGTFTEYYEFDKKVLSNVRRDFTALGDFPYSTDGKWYRATSSEILTGAYTRNGLIGQILAGEPSYIESKVEPERQAILRAEAHVVATKLGIQRAKEQGIHVGRPADPDELILAKYPEIAEALRQGKMGLREIARKLGVSRNTVRKVHNAFKNHPLS